MFIINANKNLQYSARKDLNLVTLFTMKDNPFAILNDQRRMSETVPAFFCDNEMLFFLNPKLKNTHNTFPIKTRLLIESLDLEIQALHRLYGDFELTLKAYFNDDKLNKLCKD